VSDRPPISAKQVPRATYRLQFNEHFRLADGLALVPYLHELGVSHIYASPCFMASPHSTHGYDVCDFSRLNPELGTEDDLANLEAALRQHGMGLVLDIVPNHMGIGGPENRWWWDVLTRGESSAFAGYFDVDWRPSEPRLRGKVLMPVLEDSYEQVLKHGGFQVVNEGGIFLLRQGAHRFPLSPDSLPQSLARIQNRQSSPADITPALAELNSSKGALNELIQRQDYLPAAGREADANLNYRRFFNVATLAGLRVEDEMVFKDVHRLVREWLRRGWLDGLRVDHPDGLLDPEEYLVRLRGLAGDVWIVVEKILMPEEALPESWPVAGTTGYDFLNQVNGLFVDPRGEEALTRVYEEFTGEPTDYAALVHDKKLLVLREMFTTEINRLGALLERIRAGDSRFKNLNPAGLREALMEMAACLPVYRTYIPGTGAAGPVDLALIEQAETAALGHRPDLDPELFGLLREILSRHSHGGAEEEFVLRFQQLTGPAMAKGVEDTVFYCFNQLVSLNEVGGNPGRFGFPVEAFHDACRRRQARWPDSMLASSTHDTKRSEDVRARIGLLAEIPEIWHRTVRRWSAMNECHRRDELPDRNMEYFYYQTLVGAWPLPTERAQACMEKASCEAKQHTSWTRPNPAYNAALREFVAATLADAAFRQDLEEFMATLAEAAHVTSLAQTLLKLTTPGVPDLYQGCELWDLSLMDPDNRRPVGFQLRQRLLAEAKNLPAEEIWQRRDSGLPKLWLIWKTLSLRRSHPDWFEGKSSYEALSAHGEKAAHVVAFARDAQTITVVPRLVLGLAGNWADTTLNLPPGTWRNELTGESIAGGAASLAALLRKFPVALLVREEGV
jgi:(1->4)-alpha-D-glucan 1-alpha-D-glucosylmutase